LKLQQRQKTANQYVQEVEKLAKALEGTYINGGLSTELATQYSKTHAVKAMTKNCTIDKIKLVMEAGTFNTLDEAMSKFVNSCTDATGKSNTVLFYNKSNRGNSAEKVISALITRIIVTVVTITITEDEAKIEEVIEEITTKIGVITIKIIITIKIG